MPISKVDFYNAYPSLIEIKPAINGKKLQLSTELHLLKGFMQNEPSLPKKKALYKIAKHIHDKRGSKQFCRQILSFIYNLFHGRWGTSESFYKQIKHEGQKYQLSAITQQSSKSKSSEILSSSQSLYVSSTPLVNLIPLNFTATQITDVGLAHLTNLQPLHSLGAIKKITNASLAQLANLPSGKV